MKKTKKKAETFSLKDLRPLLNTHPAVGGETLVCGNRGFKAICLSCGEVDDRIMMRKHKRGCPWIAHWKAIKALHVLLKVKP